MKEKISQLIKIQDCDNRIKQVSIKRDKGPIKIQQLQEKLNAFETKFQEENIKLESLQSNRREIEQEIQELETKTEKSNEKLSNIKSNKEYKAALKEIDDLKKRKDLSEERAIQLMEEIEELEKNNIESKNMRTEFEKQFETDKTAVEKELKKLDKKLKDLNKERNQFSDLIDQDLFKKYLFLKERREGQAISPVIQGVCQTCHMGIPPQKFNELIRGDVLMTCPHCNRMIYWGDDESFQNDLKKV